jgi:hypothetical protein
MMAMTIAIMLAFLMKNMTICDRVLAVFVAIDVAIVVAWSSFIEAEQGCIVAIVMAIMAIVVAIIIPIVIPIFVAIVAAIVVAIVVTPVLLGIAGAADTQRIHKESVANR